MFKSITPLLLSFVEFFSLFIYIFWYIGRNKKKTKLKKKTYVFFFFYLF